MHPVRLAILEALRDGEQCVCHLEAHLGYRQSYVSQHLMVLREAGLVADRKDGWNSYYKVILPGIYSLIDLAASLVGEKVVHRPVAANRAGPACSCPKCNEASPVHQLMVREWSS